jgi:hypothetical protein
MIEELPKLSEVTQDVQEGYIAEIHEAIIKAEASG